jgi:ribulose-5-phosphate 4-epimerase/fuculose-1-phosphate aldolase
MLSPHRAPTLVPLDGSGASCWSRRSCFDNRIIREPAGLVPAHLQKIHATMNVHEPASAAMLVRDTALGKFLASTLRDKPVALMRGHGNVVVGPDVQRIVRYAIYTEVNARKEWICFA